MSSIALAVGHNNTPIELQNIQPPLFSIYSGVEVVATEYHDSVSIKMDGNRKDVMIGLPWVAWDFFRLSRSEYALLSTYEGEVSIRTLDQKRNQYKNYNGTAVLLEVNGESAKFAHDALDGFIDVRFIIRDLVEQT